MREKLKHSTTHEKHSKTGMPITKRQRENSTGEIKTTKSVEGTAILQLINQRFDEQAGVIAAKVSECEERILAALNAKLDGMSMDLERLSQRVQKLEEGAADAQLLKTQLATLEAKLSAQTNASVATELRLHGVPLAEGEQLRSIFNTLCFSLDVAPTPRLRDIFRVRQSAVSTADPTIIIRLESAHDKVNLLRAAANLRRNSKQQLSLQLLGFETRGVVPIYLNEQLTKENYNIFKEAIRMKKQKQLFAVFCRRSLVHIKLTERGDVICLESALQLSQLRAKSSTPASHDLFRT